MHDCGLMMLFFSFPRFKVSAWYYYHLKYSCSINEITNSRTFWQHLSNTVSYQSACSQDFLRVSCQKTILVADYESHADIIHDLSRAFFDLLTDLFKQQKVRDTPSMCDFWVVLAAVVQYYQYYSYNMTWQNLSQWYQTVQSVLPHKSTAHHSRGSLLFNLQKFNLLDSSKTWDYLACLLEPYESIYIGLLHARNYYLDRRLNVFTRCTFLWKFLPSIKILSHIQTIAQTLRWHLQTVMSFWKDSVSVNHYCTASFCWLRADCKFKYMLT